MKYNPDLNVIPGFRKMSKQRIFNMAVRHIASTRCKSKNQYGCIYRGSGCNASVLLANDDAKRIADTLGSWPYLCRTGFVPSTNKAFIHDLQLSHDHAPNDEQFFQKWKDNMYTLAEQYKLNTSVLDKV